MTTLWFDAFAGYRLEADRLGQADRPTILFVPNFERDAAFWRAMGESLALAGRQVIWLKLRPENADGTLADHAADVRAALAQLPSRPMVVGVGAGAAIAAEALQHDAGHMAGGAILIDEPPAERRSDAFSAAFPKLRLDAGSAALQGEERAETILAQVIEFLEQHQPSSAWEFRAGSDTRTLRDAMGCFATGVTVITTVNENGDPVGLTANSFTSVSLDPPLLLVCIANSSSSAPILRSATRFAVNVLQIGQQNASSRFASKTDDRFADAAWTTGETGMPILDNSLVSFECEQHALHEAGDHFLLIGHVQRAQFEPHRDPLLFFRGKYRRMHFA